MNNSSSSPSEDRSGSCHLSIIIYIMNLTTLLIGLPLIFISLFVIYRQFKANHLANVFLINLLISDLVQFSGRPWVYLTSCKAGSIIFDVTSIIGIISSLGFMVCIAMERYFLIAHPHWYRFHFTLKLSVGTSLLVWLVSLIALAGLWFYWILFYILLFIPLPFLLFCFVGTLRGLSKTMSLSSQEKGRILATLLLVIANYTFLFLPQHTVSAVAGDNLSHWQIILFFLSPLMDPLLYIFIRKDMKHIMKEFSCCRRSPRHEGETITSMALPEKSSG